MKLLILADIDDLHWQHGDGDADVVLACGDMADQVIQEAARSFKCRVIMAVKGNHDMPTAFGAPIIDLHLRDHQHGGFTFGGFNGSWRYKPRGHFLYDQKEASVLLAAYPPVDVFVSHNSPRGIHDRDDEVHYGFDALNGYIERAKPKFLIHGHQHVDRETLVGQTRVIGVYGHRLVEV